MSIEAAMSRMAQIQAMLTSGTMPAAPPAPSSTTFSNALANASSTVTPASFASVAAGTSTPSTATTSALPASVPYGAEITQAAQANGLDPALLAGLIKQESGFNPNAGSGAGAQGLTQLMPGTAHTLGVSNPLDPVQSIN